jgi:uncharacterized paraquat-inducible protein A
MTREVDGGLVIEPEKPQQCDLCGAIAELRPYGPNGEAICFDCGMKNRETTDRAYRARIAGIDTVYVVDGES